MSNRINEADIKKIIEGDVKLLVKEAKRFGEELAGDKLAKNQIRGAFGTVRQIQASWSEDAKAAEARQLLRRVLLLQPRLAYQGRREKKVEPLTDVLIDAIKYVTEPEDHKIRTERFGYFVDFFEAILAYHTAAGGK